MSEINTLNLQKWLDLLEKAKQNMLNAENSECKCLLIECAAQHPLNNDGTPAEEFQARLNRSMELYNKYKKMGWNVKIYVPGSLHRQKMSNGNYKVDVIPLCDAGKQYLIQHGIDSVDIFADNANKQYKGDNGVYCSADECYVSSQLFHFGKYQRFIAVCSPAQLIRKVLYYLLFGTLPIVYTATPEDHSVECFHHYIYEAYGLADILETMETLQGEDCKIAEEIRKDRNPFYYNK